MGSVTWSAGESFGENRTIERFFVAGIWCKRRRALVEWNWRGESGVLFCEDVEAEDAEQPDWCRGGTDCGDGVDERLPDRVRQKEWQR
jgi:hypothetical protein